MNDNEVAIIHLEERIEELEQLLEESYAENKNLQEELDEVTAQVVSLKNRITDVDEERYRQFRFKWLQEEVKD